jgi:hypothetical protein
MLVNDRSTIPFHELSTKISYHVAHPDVSECFGQQ